MTKLTSFIVRYSWQIIALCVIPGLAAGALIPLARTDPDIRNYVPASMPSREATDRIEAGFGVQDLVLILFSDSCIINHDDLLRIGETDRALSRLGGIADRMSPFTVRTIRGENGMLVADKLISELPRDSQAIELLKKRIAGCRFARDIVVSSDMSAAAITLTINNNVPESETLRLIDSTISVHPGKAEVLKGGLPYIRRYILRDVRRDAMILVPAALLIMLLILKLSLRSWKSVAMPFSVVVLSTMISLGLIPLLGWELSVITLLVPVLLTAVANNYGIYLAARAQELRSSDPCLRPEELINRLLGSLNMPILFSGLTTIAGILGLLTHSVVPARQMGILAAAGVTIALCMSLLMIPALISVSNDKPVPAVGVRTDDELMLRLLRKLASLIVSHPGKILIISSLVVIMLSTGIFFLRIDTNQENFFPSSHPVRQASELINTRFGGSQTISVMIEGDIISPGVMKCIDSLTIETEDIPGAGRVFSVSSVLREISKAIYLPDEDGYDRIPDTREGIAQLLELYYMSGEPGDFSQLMNLENTRAHIMVKLADASGKVIRAVRTKINSAAASIPATVTTGGYALIMADFADSLIRGQVASLIFALVTVFILLAIIFRSFSGGLTGSIPLGISILIVFGFMGLTGIAIDAATALLSSIMIGVGVDFTIQYIWCLNTFLRDEQDMKTATVNALCTMGRSIVINAFSVMAGFSALLLSGFTSIRFFGFLVLVSIGSCLAGALVIVPSFMILFRPAFVYKFK